MLRASGPQCVPVRCVRRGARHTGGVSQPPEKPRRSRHLLDPEDLRGSHLRSQSSDAQLTQVQRWVMSVLAATTIFHLAVGLAIAALAVDGTRAGAEVGLVVIACLFGIIAVATAFAIHGRSLLSPWLALGVLPPLVVLLVARLT